MASGPRYSLRYAPTLIPTMEICLPVTSRSFSRDGAPVGGLRMRYDVVAKKRGINQKHAMSRALRWTRAHGDPR